MGGLKLFKPFLGARMWSRVENVADDTLVVNGPEARYMDDGGVELYTCYMGWVAPAPISRDRVSSIRY